MLLILVMFLFEYFNCIDIYTYYNNTNTKVLVYDNNTKSKNFTYKKSLCCERQNIYIDESQYDITKFIIDKDIDNSDTIQILGCNLLNINKKINDHLIFTVIDNQTSILQVAGICQLNDSFYDSSVIQVLLKINDKDSSFIYIKKCVNKEHQSFSKRFIFPIILLLTIVFGYIILLAEFTPNHFKLEYEIQAEKANRVHQNDNVNHNSKNNRFHKAVSLEYGMIILILCLLFAFIISNFDIKIVKLTIQITVAILYVVIMYFFFFILFRKYVKEKYFSKLLFMGISVLIGIGCSCIVYFLPFWFFIDIFVFCLLYVLHEYFYFQDYLQLFSFSLLFLAYDAILISKELLVENKTIYPSFNSVESNELINSPIKLIIPNILVADPTHPCIFISWIDLFILSSNVIYAKNFDSYFIRRNKYYKIVLIILGLGIVLTVFLQSFIIASVKQIFIIFIVLSLFSLLVILKINRDFKDYKRGISFVDNGKRDFISNEEKFEDFKIEQYQKE